MANDRFVYVTYIRTTPEKLWEALLKPEFTRQYWFGVTLESDWKRVHRGKWSCRTAASLTTAKSSTSSRKSVSSFAGGVNAARKSEPRASLDA